MMYKMMRLPFLLLSLICLISQPALAAAAINDAGAQALKSHIQELLERQKSSRAFAGGSLITEGDILVEQADSYYAVTLPDITLSDAKGRRTNVGIIAVNATPGDKAGNWKISLSLPTPISWTDTAGHALGKLTIGSQRLSGIWNETLSGFTTLDAAYGAVRVDDLSTKTTQTIANVGIQSSMKETAPDLWSGDATVTLDKVASSSTVHTGNGSADNITFTVKIADLSGAKQKQMREKLGAFKENTDPQDLENMSPAGQMALYNMMIDILRSAGDNASIGITLKNAMITMPAIAKQTARKVTMKAASFAFQLSGMNKNNVTLALRSTLNDLVSTPDTNDMMPSDMDIDLKLENLPFEELVKVGRDSINSASKGGMAKQFAGIQAMMVLPQILSQAGAQVSIVHSSISSAAYDMMMDGKMKADSTSAVGAAGRVKAEITGLDGLITRLNGQIASADALEKAKLQKLLQTLTVMNLAGQAEKRGDKTVKIYDFELTKDGQMLLNGSDLSLLTGTPSPVKTDKAPTTSKPATR